MTLSTVSLSGRGKHLSGRGSRESKEGERELLLEREQRNEGIAVGDVGWGGLPFPF